MNGAAPTAMRDGLKKIVWAAGAVAAFLVVAGAVERLLRYLTGVWGVGSSPRLAFEHLGLLLLPSALYPIGRALFSTDLFREAFRAEGRWPWWKGASWGVASAVFVGLAGAPVYLLLGRPLSPGDSLLRLLCNAASDLFEELGYRGFLQGALAKRLSPWVSVGISGAVFSALHSRASPELFPCLFLGNLLLGWLYFRSKSIVSVWACHFAVDAIFGALFGAA